MLRIVYKRAYTHQCGFTYAIREIENVELLGKKYTIFIIFYWIVYFVLFSFFICIFTSYLYNSSLVIHYNLESY